MKIEIESDVFDIIKRIKDIDKNYYIMYNLDNCKYELHYRGLPNTYCFTCPFDNLDKRFIDLVYKTNIQYIDNIVEDIDNNNVKLEQEYNNKVNSQTNYQLREIYNFSNNSSKNLDDVKAFTSVWR